MLGNGGLLGGDGNDDPSIPRAVKVQRARVRRRGYLGVGQASFGAPGRSAGGGGSPSDGGILPPGLRNKPK